MLDEAARIAIERRVLQMMCQGTPVDCGHDTAKHLLQNYRWREPLHRIIYEVLVSLPTSQPEIIRAQLPAQMTRRGFPDVPLDEFFPSHLSNDEEVESLLRSLLEAG